jgi:hypothetical protein
MQWFRNDELSQGAGLDPKTKMVAVWFHGIISRERAEELLQRRAPGAFLIRVSERIWGYTLSYALGMSMCAMQVVPVSYLTGDSQTKHFLVERSSDGYQFMGNNQTVHRTLWDLVSYHEVGANRTHSLLINRTKRFPVGANHPVWS